MQYSQKKLCTDKEEVNLSRINTGKKGERLAQSFLRKEGYTIIERNYKTKAGEIDLIGKNKNFIAFIEVRSQNTKRFGLPEYSIDRKKQDRLSKAALLYIKKHRLEDRDCRFDIVGIEETDSGSPKIRLIKNAFDLDTRYRY
ncbi:YraN family protein [Candidatus Omnitrophota bacterium]